MTDNFFSGSLHTLKEYWEQVDRAQRFKKGGTRTSAVEYVLGRIETDIHKGSWVDIACGAGFIQSRISDSVGAILKVGLDFSRVMLDQIDDDEIQRILGSAFDLPLREDAVSISTNFFSLSDYPDLTRAFEEMSRIIKTSGVFSHVDYAENDEYWNLRSQLHESVDEAGNKIIGNINLRSLDDIKKAIPQRVRVTEQRIIEYPVTTEKINSNFPLPEELTRRFLFTEVYKPRSLQDLT